MELKFKEAKDFAFNEYNANIDYYKQLKTSLKCELLKEFNRAFVGLTAATIVMGVVCVILILLDIIFSSNNHQDYTIAYVCTSIPFMILIITELFDLLIYKITLNSYKNKSNEQLYFKYLLNEYNIDAEYIESNLNYILVKNADNKIISKYHYEFLNFDSTNLNDIEFTGDIKEFKDLGDTYSEQQVNFIRKQMKHNKKSLKELQTILKNYVLIVEQNNDKLNSKLAKDLVYSDSSKIYETIENKYKGD